MNYREQLQIALGALRCARDQMEDEILGLQDVLPYLPRCGDNRQRVNHAIDELITVLNFIGTSRSVGQ